MKVSSKYSLFDPPKTIEICAWGVSYDDTVNTINDYLQIIRLNFIISRVISEEIEFFMAFCLKDKNVLRA